MNNKIIYHIKELITQTGSKWDALAPKEQDAAEFAERYINPEPPRRKDEETFSLEYCLASSGETLNDHFRYNDKIENIDLEISDMVSQHACKKDLVLYRGVCDPVIDLMRKNAEDIPGVDLYEKGYLQCSLVKGREANYKTKLRIYVPAGSPVVYMGDVNHELEIYYEATIQHGGMLKIISIDKTYINCLLLKTA